MGLLKNSSDGGLFRQRGGALVIIIGLHVVAVAVAMHTHMRVDANPETVAMQVVIVSESSPVEAPPLLAPPPLVQMSMPPIEVPVVDFPAPTAITPPPVVVAAVATVAQPAPPVAVQSDGPVVLSENEVDYLRRPELRYPRAAKQARLQGTVMVSVLIDADGRPQEVSVQQSSGYEQLDREGCDAISHALFKPHRIHGVPRRARAIIPVEFSLGIKTASRD